MDGGEEEKKSKTKLEKGEIKKVHVSQTEVTWKLKEIPYSGKFSRYLFSWNESVML